MRAAYSIHYLLLALAGFHLTPWVRAEDFDLKDQDVVAFFGDSNIEWGTVPQIVENYTNLRFPERKVLVYNAGKAGDTALEAAAWRLEHDVFERTPKPNKLFVIFGLNDLCWGNLSTAEFEENKRFHIGAIRDIIKACNRQSPPVRAYILPYPTVEKPAPEKLKANSWLRGVHTLTQKGSALAELFQAARTTALELGAQVLEVDTPEAEKSGRQTSEDGGHRNPHGNLVWAAAILKALKAPAEVSSVHISVVGTPRVVSASNAEVTGLKESGPARQGVEFQRKDFGLPFVSSGFDFRGVNPTIQQATPVDEFSVYTLRVEGLVDGWYSIQAGEGIITQEGGISSKELEKGVNLARMGFNSSEVRSPWAGLSLQLQWNSEAKYRLEEMGKDLEWSGLWLQNYKQRRKQLDRAIENLSEESRAFVAPRAIPFAIRKL